MQEIWKDIPGCEGLYQVSSLGRIKSFNKSTKFHGAEFHYLKPCISNRGYAQVTFYDKDKNRHKSTIHRLVATLFIDNPNNYPCINHKDENKQNNRVDNLEWCTYKHNNNYGTARMRTKITKSRPVSQYTLDGFWIATYMSAKIASDLLGCSYTIIRDCCNGKLNTAHGYLWEWCYFDQKHKIGSLSDLQES